MSIPFKLEQQVTTRRKYEGRVTGTELINLINRELLRNTGEEPIPENATVTVYVPGGADWSNTSLDIDESCPILIEWEMVDHG